MSQDLPFSAEYAKSGRSSCKACGSSIPKDHIRVAKMVQSPHFDGKVALWNHFNCFFRKHSIKSTGDIKGFGTLRYEDQSKIKQKVGGVVSTGTDEVSVEVVTEYAKSGQATCNGCFVKIAKADVRIGVWVEADASQLAWATNGKKLDWHHPGCFAERKGELDIDQNITADMIDGFKRLKVEDKAELVLLLGKGGKKKKKKKVKNDENIPPEQAAREKQLKEQSNYLQLIRQALKDLPNKYIREMLAVNGYPTHGLDIRLMDRCSDGIAFGRFNEPCPICENTYFSLGDNTYLCKGDVSEFTKCTNTLAAPKRTTWILTEKVTENSEYLSNLKLKTGKRLFNVAAPSTVETAPILPLLGYVFCSTEEQIELKGTVHIIKTVIEKRGGGKVHKKFTAKCNALLMLEIDTANKMLKRATSLETPIVDCRKLVEGLLSNTLTDISSVCFPGYEGDDYVKKRRSVFDLKSATKRERSMGGADSSSKRAKITVHNGAEVFQETGLSANKNVQVYKDLSGVVYAVTLGHVDLVRGKNSYYKLQVLKRGEHRYNLFRAWGRIGTDIGGTTFDAFLSPNGAIDMFKEHYLDKSGNEWGEPFEKVPGKMYRLDLDYGPDEENSTVKPGSLTKLGPSIQGLVKLIFDIAAMKETLLEFEIDLNKMPLGKISKNQIKEAFKILSAAQDLLEDIDSKQIHILDASTRFYTLIPHDFGMASPPLLNTLPLIQSKTKMLETLLELEIAYSMTRVCAEDAHTDPIDLHYRTLKSEISVLDRATQEFTLLQEYVASTHAETHNLFTLEIEDIFKVTRDGEASKYKPFKTLHNRKLLWHGSRISNFAGILSQGLRIAPPEAPVTGYMFGKGIYFADMVSKSANYCCTSPANNTGLLLLCEVALGDMYCLKDATYINKLPAGKHSCKGLGKTAPCTERVTETGCVVPVGPGKQVREDSSLLYNEYIVYDTAQVSVKYLLKLKFGYGGRRR